jgi:hypothetical protein
MKLQRTLFNFNYKVYVYDVPEKKVQVFRTALTLALGNLY